MTKTVYKYKIYCDTEEIFVEGWGTTEPTKCYNNIDHLVNINSIQIADTVQSNEVVINQNNKAIAGRFHIECITLTAPPDKETSVYHKFDVGTSLHSFNFALNAGTSGDTFSIAVNPDTPLGLITQGIKSESAVINVSQYVIPYMFPGFYLTLTDGINTDQTIKIVSRDLIANTVTLVSGVKNNYSEKNTQMLLSYYCIKEMPIILGTTYSFGGEIISASNVSAGTVVKFTYNNSSPDTEKTVAVYLCGLI